MQNDFITGALGTEEAVAITDYVQTVVEDFQGTILFTRDTHTKDYLTTREGSYLPVEHCIEGTHGWEICNELLLASTESTILNKPTFGSTQLVATIQELQKDSTELESNLTFTLVGLCTDICVISNAFLLKATFPESTIIVDSKGCAGVTPASHNNALEAMKMCHIEIR